MYKFKSDYTGVIRISDNLFISFDDSDPNKAEFDEWAKSNLPLPPEFTCEELQSQNVTAPIVPLSRVLEWYEESYIGQPQIIDGKWVRLEEISDLRISSSLEVLKARRLEQLKAIRYSHEVSGVEVNGAIIETDHTSQSKITAAYTRAVRDPNFTVPWQAVNGFFLLDATQIIAVGDIVMDYIQKCFVTQSAYVEQINASTTIEDLVNIDITQGWGGD